MSQLLKQVAGIFCQQVHEHPVGSSLPAASAQPTLFEDGDRVDVQFPSEHTGLSTALLTPQQLSFLVHAARAWALARRVVQIVERYHKQRLTARVGTESGINRTIDVPVTVVITGHPNGDLSAFGQRCVRHLAQFLSLQLQGTLSPEECGRYVARIFHDLLAADLTPAGQVKFLAPLEEFLDLHLEDVWNGGATVATWIFCDFDGHTPQTAPVEQVRLGARLCRHAIIERYLSLLLNIRDLFLTANEKLVAQVDLMRIRLEATKRGIGIEPAAYQTEVEFRDAIAALSKYAEITPGIDSAGIKRLERRFERFGFTLLAPQPRFNTGQLDTVARALWPFLGLGELPTRRDEAARLTAIRAAARTLQAGCVGEAQLRELQQELAVAQVAGDATELELAVWVFSLLLCVRDIARKNGRVHHLVLSNASTTSDILLYRLLIRVLGINGAVPMPIFEDPRDLDNMIASLSGYLDKREAVGANKNEPLAVLLGGSDAQRLGSCFEWFRLASAITELHTLTGTRNVELQLEFGRADVPVRWGGPFSPFIDLNPPLNANALFRTVQGGDIIWELLDPDVSRETLGRKAKLSVPAVSPGGSKTVKSSDPAFGKHAALIGRIRAAIVREFTQLIGDERFSQWLAHTLLPLSGLFVTTNRPASKGKSGAGPVGLSAQSSQRSADYNTLRAIVITRAGVATGVVLQGLCVGTVLKRFLESDGAELRALNSGSPFFRNWLKQVLSWVCKIADPEGMKRLTESMRLSPSSPIGDFAAKDGQDAKAVLQALCGIKPATIQPDPLAHTCRLYMAALLRHSVPGLPPSSEISQAIANCGSAILAACETNG